jgi:hypothetical protein
MCSFLWIYRKSVVMLSFALFYRKVRAVDVLGIYGWFRPVLALSF